MNCQWKWYYGPNRSGSQLQLLFCRFDEGLPDVAGKYHRSFQMTVIGIFRTYMRLGVLFDGYGIWLPAMVD